MDTLLVNGVEREKVKMNALFIAFLDQPWDVPYIVVFVTRVYPRANCKINCHLPLTHPRIKLITISYTYVIVIRALILVLSILQVPYLRLALHSICNTAQYDRLSSILSRNAPLKMPFFRSILVEDGSSGQANNNAF